MCSGYELNFICSFSFYQRRVGCHISDATVILVFVRMLLSDPYLASLSAASFPIFPTCPRNIFGIVY